MFCLQPTECYSRNVRSREEEGRGEMEPTALMSGEDDEKPDTSIHVEEKIIGIFENN